MKAIKGNKIYTIDETQKNFYQEQGYDITEDDGAIMEYGAGKTVSYEEYKVLEEKAAKLEKEINRLQAEKKGEKSLEDMSLEELQAYAEEKKIDIGKATTQEGILKKIKESLE